MREIKFRAWDKVEKIMLYAGIHDRNWYATPTNDEKGCHTVRAKMPEDRTCLEMMEYTGLKDKNGKEIFEGDIVKCGKESNPSKVIYDEKTASFRSKFKDEEKWFSMPLAMGINIAGDGKNLSEIIGNIYENPELLK